MYQLSSSRCAWVSPQLVLCVCVCVGWGQARVDSHFYHMIPRYGQPWQKFFFFFFFKSTEPSLQTLK